MAKDVRAEKERIYQEWLRTHPGQQPPDLDAGPPPKPKKPTSAKPRRA